MDTTTTPDTDAATLDAEIDGAVALDHTLVADAYDHLIHKANRIRRAITALGDAHRELIPARRTLAIKAARAAHDACELNGADADLSIFSGDNGWIVLRIKIDDHRRIETTIRCNDWTIDFCGHVERRRLASRRGIWDASAALTATKVALIVL